MARYANWLVASVLALAAQAMGQAPPRKSTAAIAPALESPVSAEICGDCHRGAHEGWKASGHAHAMDIRLFQDALHYAEVDLGAGARETCLGCHAPVAAATGDPGLHTKVAWEGVTCDYCHSIRDVSQGGPNPVANVEYTRARTGPWKGESPSRHGALASELHKSSLLCSICHEYRNANGLALVTTYSEWRASSYAKEGHECQTCHMPSVGRVDLVQRIVATGTSVERHSHCEGCHEVTAAGQPASGAPGPASGLRDRGKVNLHDTEGSRSKELLTTAIAAQLTAVREGGRIRVNVEVTNRGAAHYVPTGSPLRRLVLEVRADTDTGRHAIQERIYRRAIADSEGRPVEREPLLFVRGVKVIADTRLAPEEKRAETFVFDAEPGVETRVTAALSYVYSPLEMTESRSSATFLTLGAVVR